MAQLFLNDHGNGHTSTNALPPMVEGESFTIVFVPDYGEFLQDVRAFDSYDNPVALPAVVNNEITMTWRSAWNNLYVDVYYSGITPPPPPPTGNSLWWLIMAMKKNNERGLNPYVRN